MWSGRWKRSRSKIQELLREHVKARGSGEKSSRTGVNGCEPSRTTKSSGKRHGGFDRNLPSRDDAKNHEEKGGTTAKGEKNRMSDCQRAGIKNAEFKVWEVNSRSNVLGKENV